MKKLALVLIALVLVTAGVTVAGANPAFADGPSKAVSTKLTLNGVAETQTKGWLSVSATLTTDDGQPLSNRLVTFSRQVDFFGSREISLGTATTDATGEAVLVYQPAQDGRQEVKANFRGDEGYAGAETSNTIEVSEAIERFEPQPALPLASVRKWLTAGVAILVVAVCAVLFGVFATTLWGVWIAGRSLESVRQTAPQPATPAVESSH
ncbi:MAG: hypothetical protein M5U01_03915 [Ardenticatenaceae bacterium]|nr:hypothetical protein [Ardenticatenaceae bacterium]HBY97435.1 hypothetical protein [Chloroflexota bacterium]